MFKKWKVTESGQRVRRKLAASLSALLMVIATVVGIAAPASAQMSPTLCGFAIFVGVRGTNAPAGVGLMHGNRAWVNGGYGALQPLRNLLPSTDIPYYAESLAFDATGGAPYPTVVNAGRDMLVQEINWLNAQCPWSPIILAGHSMGADVVLSALQNQAIGSNLTTSARAQVYAAAVFGDPTYKPYKGYNAPGNGTNAGVFPRANTADLEGMRTWGWQYGTAAEGWVYKVRSYCRAGDFFCQSNTADSNFVIHNNYSTQEADAFKWIEFMLTSAN